MVMKAVLFVAIWRVWLMLLSNIITISLVTVEATIDFFDPFPETSGGLVRPFELLCLGTTPLDWFEFGVDISVSFSVYVKVGLFIGPLEITGKIQNGKLIWLYLYLLFSKLTDVLAPSSCYSF